MSGNETITTPATLEETMGSLGIVAARELYDNRLKKEDHQLDIHAVYKMRNHLPVLLAFHTAQLDAINQASFAYLTVNKKENLINELTFTYYLLYLKCQLDLTEKRGSNLKKLNKARTRCETLIDKLTFSLSKPGPETPVLEESIGSDKHIKFCGLTIVAPEAIKSVMALIGDKMGDIVHDITGSIKGAMGEVNSLRLYWVWGGGLLSTVLSLIPDTFFNVTQAQKGVAAPSPITGCMSWMLYYARFGINLGLLLKHTIAGPWMKKEEAKIPTWERFKTQWQLRKFALLNDSIWATLNMSCFFWLTGSGIAGYSGNVLTAGLLLMDLGLSIWKFAEAQTQHNQQLEELDNAYSIRKEEIAKIKADFNHQRTCNGDEALKQIEKAHDATINALEQKQKSTEQLRNDALRTWKHSRNHMINDIVYSAALLAGFGLMCCLFCPPALVAASTATILGLVGATFCFVLNIISAGVAGGLDIYHTKQSDNQTKQAINDLLEQFGKLDDPNSKKLLYLDIRAQIATSVHQQKMIRMQAIKLIRTILVDAMIPVVIFTTLVFMPLGMGLGVMAAAFALGALSKFLLKQFEPTMGELPEFQPHEFNTFNKDPQKAVNQYLKNNKRFLTHTSSDPVTTHHDDFNSNDDLNSEPKDDDSLISSLTIPS